MCYNFKKLNIINNVKYHIISVFNYDSCKEKIKKHLFTKQKNFISKFTSINNFWIPNYKLPIANTEYLAVLYN